jgi:hypothetical protein
MRFNLCISNALSVRFAWNQAETSRWGSRATNPKLKVCRRVSADRLALRDVAPAAPNPHSLHKRETQGRYDDEDEQQDSQHAGINWCPCK